MCSYYGDVAGMRVARKHISWYTKGLAGSANFRHNMNTLQTIELQQAAINDFFAELKTKNERLVYAEIESEDVLEVALAAWIYENAHTKILVWSLIAPKTAVYRWALNPR